MPRRDKRPAERYDSSRPSKSLKTDNTDGSSQFGSQPESSVNTEPTASLSTRASSVYHTGRNRFSSVQRAKIEITGAFPESTVPESSTTNTSSYWEENTSFTLQAHCDHYWDKHGYHFQETANLIDKLIRDFRSDEMIGEEAEKTGDAIRSAIGKATEIFCELGLCCGRRMHQSESTGDEAHSGSDTCTTLNIANTKNVSKKTMRAQYDTWKVDLRAWEQAFQDAQDKKAAGKDVSLSEKAEGSEKQDITDAPSSRASAEEGEASVPTADGDQQSAGEPTENRHRSWFDIVTG